MSTAMPATPGSRFLNGATGAARSRTEAVLDAIKHAILAGELKPGRSLVETELAQLLGVSKTPVREALKTLAGAGSSGLRPAPPWTPRRRPRIRPSAAWPTGTSTVRCTWAAVIA